MIVSTLRFPLSALFVFITSFQISMEATAQGRRTVQHRVPSVSLVLQGAVSSRTDLNSFSASVSDRVVLRWRGPSAGEGQLRVRELEKSFCGGSLFSDLGDEAESEGWMARTIPPCASGARLEISYIMRIKGSELASRSITLSVPKSRSFELGAQVGLYNWGGRLAEHGPGVEIADGAALARISNTSSIRITLLPSCEGLSSLTESLRQPAVREVLADPQFRTVMITGYDAASLEGCRMQYNSLPAMTLARQARIEEEIYQFGRYLYDHYGYTNKDFYLLNWEGENNYYGPRYVQGFVTDPEYRREVLEQYSKIYSGNRDPHDSVKAMSLWFQARQRGVNRLRREVAAKSPTFSLMHVPEVMAVELLKKTGYPALLDTALIDTKLFDGLSYSAWETSAESDPLFLQKIMSSLRAAAKGRPIFIGELGTDCSSQSVRNLPCDEDLLSLTRQFVEAGAQSIIYWNVSSSAASDRGGWTTGIFNSLGLPRRIVEIWQNPKEYGRRTPSRNTR
jgi:hypothetical protein